MTTATQQRDSSFRPAKRGSTQSDTLHFVILLCFAIGKADKGELGGTTGERKPGNELDENLATLPRHSEALLKNLVDYGKTNETLCRYEPAMFCDCSSVHAAKDEIPW